MIGFHLILLFFLITMAVAQMITNTLNTADPTIVPAHILDSVLPVPNIANNAKIEVNNSGALLHIAINVAHVTSFDIFSLFEICSRDSTKYLSQIIANK
jgi:hypothetical protein